MINMHDIFHAVRTAVLFPLLLASLALPAQTQNALSFDGTNDNVTVTAASSLISGSSTLSMTCWAYLANGNIIFPDYDGICGFRNNTDADFYLIHFGNSALEARFRNSSGQNFDVVYNNLVVNSWHHFAFTYDGDNIRLFVNGALAGSSVASGVISNTAEDFYIGNLIYVGNYFYLNGNADEVSLWNKALSQDEILHIYNCAIDPGANNLLLYYKFDQGIAGANNAGINTLLPSAGSMIGTLNNFMLNGPSSNWVQGISTPVNYLNDTICQGEVYLFGTQTLNAPGVYTQTYPLPSGCDSVVELTLSVTTVNTSLSLFGATLMAQQPGATYKWVDCNNGFSLIPGAASQTYTATLNGNYAVIVTYNGCTDTSACVAVNTVGINKTDALQALFVYPNPVVNELVLGPGPVPELLSLRVYSPSGQEVLRAQLAPMETPRLDVNQLESGCYFLQLTCGNKQRFLRFIK